MAVMERWWARPVLISAIYIVRTGIDSNHQPSLVDLAPTIRDVRKDEPTNERTKERKKRNETKRNETKRNETKRNETKRNETKERKKERDTEREKRNKQRKKATNIQHSVASA
jgi:hypothetical protein